MSNKNPMSPAPPENTGKKVVTFVVAANGKMSGKGQSLQYEPVKALKDEHGTVVMVPMSTVPGGGPTLIMYLRNEYFRKVAGIDISQTPVFRVTVEPVE